MQSSFWYILPYLCSRRFFNFPRIRWSATHASPVESKEAKFIDIIEECFLYQHTNEPTRCRGDNMSSQLDLIFTNELEMVSDVQYMAPLSRSDHQMLKFNCRGFIKFVSRWWKIKNAVSLNLYNYTL